MNFCYLFIFERAFSSVELLESRYAAQTNHLQQFSIQEIIDCSRSIKTPYGNLAGCEGGQLCAALFWLNQVWLVVLLLICGNNLGCFIILLNP